MFFGSDDDFFESLSLIGNDCSFNKKTVKISFSLLGT